MGVDLSGGQVCMAEEILHRADVGAGLQQMRGKTVTKTMRGHAFVQARGASRRSDGVLKGRVQDMMAPSEP